MATVALWSVSAVFSLFVTVFVVLVLVVLVGGGLLSSLVAFGGTLFGFFLLSFGGLMAPVAVVTLPVVAFVVAVNVLVRAMASTSALVGPGGGRP